MPLEIDRRKAGGAFVGNRKGQDTLFLLPAVRGKVSFNHRR